MRYSLLLHYPEPGDGELGRDEAEAGMRAFASYAEALEQARVLISAEVLQPSSDTTTLRSVRGELQIQDGPMADTKEQLAGIVVVDVPDLDAALHWARQAPSLAWGAVEIRPGATHTEGGVWRPST